MAVDPKSKTAKNLAYAFAGEAQARTKYNYYASKARKEGFEQIAAIFEATANNEKEHAKLWFEELHGIGTTLENLADAAAGEHEEWTVMYKQFAEEAKAEGYDALAKSFERIAAIEKRHEERYRKLIENIKTGEVWARTEKLKWECRNCGHIHYGAKAPKICPACNHPQAFFEIEAENY
ncbi:MAG: rubrerythrin family protein [Lentisphaerae bacterium]|nr:rubrerythrin family protein [Lentisphaerota bacterium]